MNLTLGEAQPQEKGFQVSHCCSHGPRIWVHTQGGWHGPDLRPCSRVPATQATPTPL